MAKALAPYRAKRNFGRTPEPAAGKGRSGRTLSFVVQKHAARRLHYDLRLEWRGVLKSWAVTKEPLQDPTIKRLAVEVEDHPLAYGSFAGTIPAGEYGAGTVEIWDRGRWSPRDPTQVDADLAAGHLKFTLDGTRMRGGFALIRMKPKSNERNPGRNWLLIKERDDTAPVEIKQGGWLPFQHCLPAAAPPTGASWIHELKLDGYRLQCAVAKGRVTLRTRSGLDWTARFPSIAKAAAALPDSILDGEAVALNDQGLPDFAALQAALSGERDAHLVFFAFDLLRDGPVDTRNLPQRERKDRLAKLIARSRSDRLRYLEDFTAPGDAVLRSACRLSMEGVVSKRVDRPYTAGRSGHWIKTKCRGTEEVVIGGWSMTQRGTGIGALLVGARRDGRLAYLGRVGTGFGADRSRRLLEALGKLRRKTTPFDGRQPARTSDVNWAEPQLVAQVAFAGWTEEGLLRQASFVALREDKPAEEVEMATMSPVEPRTTPAPAPRSERLTNPGRVLWPATDVEPDITKAMLAEYYARMAPRLLQQLRGRPLSILRTPDGIEGERFFQRHAMRGSSPLLKQVRIPGQVKPFLMVEDEGGLLALAQISATELHPWGASADNPERPDRLVFDLDPGPGVPFAAVRNAAKRLRALLAEHRLTGFARLSGGKGIHVVVPIAAPRRGRQPDWPRAKSVALAISRLLEAEDPANFTTRLAKSARGGRIFLDYLRNDRLATAIASWSPRARPGAPVAMPVSWAALARSERPDDHRLAPLLRGRMPRDPWDGISDAAAPLPMLEPPPAPRRR
ncbi:DNA ligase D [Roseomonas sp. JC162]|uniref:DNA ligase (ATP) n=1 Tax=Neoroseomonas marina TaxID=1232220 RepID=A0A848EAC0_9PROT|nr:DNA ligase D [Neoroseomonas marina]NMJ41431.1 DNA ligase D [Neoroseomonas marina]